MSSFNFESIFQEAVSEGFGPSIDLAPGKYIAEIKSANFGESKAGAPKAGFMFVAQDGSVSADGEDMSGGTIWLNATFSEKAAGFAARDCASLGVTGAMLNADPQAAVQTTVGQVWSIEVKVSKDGQWTNCYLGKKQGGDTGLKAVPSPAPAFTPAPTAVESFEKDLDTGDTWAI